MAIDQNDQTPKIVCNVQTGSVVVARHPQKFFITFQASESDGTLFFFTAYYSKAPTQDLYINAQSCDDKGKSVSDLNKPKPTINSDPNPADNQEVASEATLIPVTSISDRTNQMVIQLQNPLVQESILTQKNTKSMSQLIIIGIASFLLFLLGLLMVINVLLSKKHMQQQ